MPYLLDMNTTTQGEDQVTITERDERAAYVAKQEADLVKWANRQNANRFFQALGYWPDNYCPDTETTTTQETK